MTAVGFSGDGAKAFGAAISGRFVNHISIDIARIDARGLNGPLAWAQARTSLDADTRIGNCAPAFLKGKFVMSIRISRFATAMLVAATILLMPGRSWAVYYWLGPSKDDWGIKYDVEAIDAGRDTLTVVFTVADEGRLKPLDLIELIALNKETDNQGGHTYDVKARIELKSTKDGRRAGQVQIRKEFADRAQFRILTRTIDGKAQSGESYYEIPINKFLNKTPATASSSASRPD